MKRTAPSRPIVARNNAGFTIIEVLIVLAIAAFILLIIFLAVPALNRNLRNHNRKEAVDYVASELNSYYSMHLGFPLSGTGAANDNRTSFDNGLLANGPSSLFTVRYTDESGSHEYPFDSGSETKAAMDQISIEAGHKCNRTPGLKPGDTDYPLETANGGDANYKAYVVWTQLENAPVYCVDNAFN